MNEAVRPWSRFFARMIDHFLYYVIFSTIIPVRGLLGLYLVLFISIIFCEATLLSSWGYTPGKWVFSIQIRTADSKKLSFIEAAKRTWKVIFYGFWLMIPIFSLIGCINSFVYLTHKGTTTWDKDGGFIVRNKRG